MYILITDSESRLHGPITPVCAPAHLHTYLSTLMWISIQPIPSPHLGLQHLSLLLCLRHTILTPAYAQWNSRIANPYPRRNLANYRAMCLPFFLTLDLYSKIPFFKVNWVPRPCVQNLQCHCHTITQLYSSITACISTHTLPSQTATSWCLI